MKMKAKAKLKNVKLLVRIIRDDGDLKKSFCGQSGLQKVPKGGDPYDFFGLLFDDTFFSMTVAETNKYGEMILDGKWKELIQEFKIFLSLLLHRSTIKCPRIKNYCSTNKQFGFNCFSQHMSRLRFLFYFTLHT